MSFAKESCQNRTRRTQRESRFTALVHVSVVFLVCVFAASSVFHARSAKTDGPDLVILNAKIFTGTGSKPRDGGIAIKDGRIVAVDKTYKIRDMMVRETKRIDARDRLVLPGFNDSHVHFDGIGNKFTSIDLRTASNGDEITKALSQSARYIPKNRWIQGGEWDVRLLGKGIPNRRILDAATRENPILLYSSDPAIAVANSVALSRAGIRKGKTAPVGGSIDVDSEGIPTGVLRGTAILLVRGIQGRSSTFDTEEVLETASNYAASLGVTSVQDMQSDDIAAVLKTLERDGKLKTRVYDCIALKDFQKLAGKTALERGDTEMVRQGCLKSYAENEPSANIELARMIADADKTGLQIMIHSIGKSANDSILDIFEETASRNGPRDRRSRIEHAYGFSRDRIDELDRNDIIASIQPELFSGPQPVKKMLKKKARVAFGSDASIAEFNPLLGIFRSVTLGDEEERISVAEAVRLYTAGSAFAEFQENEKGTIEKGKYADLVILSENIFDIPAVQILQTEVEMTLVGGRIVFDARVN